MNYPDPAYKILPGGGLTKKLEYTIDKKVAEAVSDIEGGAPTDYDTLKELADGKQDKLVSGTNIKTLNSASLLGSGNVSINGVANVSAPTTADGTWQITLTNGDTITIDLNHVHPQYLKYELVQSLPVSPDSDTLYLIAES